MKVKIYTLTDPITNKIRYVGKTELSLEKRLYYHIYDLKRSKNKHKNNWFNLLIKKGFKPIIELIDEVPFEEWNFWESYWINQIKTWGFNLINMKDGGTGFTSKQVKDLWNTESYRNFHTDRVQGSKHPFFGKHHSEETKKILKDKCPHYGVDHYLYGKNISEEIKINMRNSQPNLKIIFRTDLNGNIIDEWIGIKYMCKSLGLDDGAVVRVLKGKAKQHKGFKFKYKE